MVDFWGGNMGWMDGNPDRLALLGLAVMALALLGAFGAAIDYSLGRRRRARPAGIDSMTTSDDIHPSGRESKSRLRRRASVARRRFRKSRQLRGNLLFLSSFVTAPRNVGSVTPSSKGLGRAMAAELPADYRTCVELGGGTGSLTSAILAAGVPSDKLVVIERDHKLAAHLRKRFPRVRVIEGDAQHLREILAEAGIDHVDAVVSGLPLRSLPIPVRNNIVSELFAALDPKGVYVQFTYWGEPPVAAEIVERYGIISRKTRRVWRNIPPANVWRYERAERPD